MQRVTLGKSGSEAAPYLQGRITSAFSSNSLVNTIEMTAAIQYILTAALYYTTYTYTDVYTGQPQAPKCGLTGALFLEIK